LNSHPESNSRLNQGLDKPGAQGALAAGNILASLACFRVNKTLYRVAGGILAVFAGYHIYKAVKAYRMRRREKVKEEVKEEEKNED